MKFARRLLFATILVMFVGQAAYATPLIVSTFDANRSGWAATFGAVAGTGSIWQSAAGNPGGHIVSPDRTDVGNTFTWYFYAASGDGSPLIGNHADAVGGLLEYDMQISDFAGNYYNNADDFDIWLSGGGLLLLYRVPFQPNATWQHFEIPLLASAGWRKNTFFPSTVAATDADLSQALSNITEIRIRGNYTDAPTTTRIDNVGFYSVPEPSSGILAAITIFLAAAFRRRYGSM